MSSRRGSSPPSSSNVPAGATSVTFTTSGGVGNADLYIQRGWPPDTGAGQYQYRSIGGTNSESITVNTGAMSGKWHVLLQGTAGYNGLTITASYTPILIKTYRDLAGAAGDKIRKQVVVPAGATRLTFTMSGGTGNADLYVRFGSPPRVNIWDYRPYLPDNNESVVIVPPSGGTYYLMVRGFTDFSGVKLRVTVE